MIRFISNVAEFLPFDVDSVRSVPSLREHWKDFIGTDSYFDFIAYIATDGAHNGGSVVWIQAEPSFRVCPPGYHGVDPHADSWYGHSMKTVTHWISLVDGLPGNLGLFFDSEEFVQPASYGYGDAVSFSGDEVHYSLKNKTEITRVSLDIRTSISGDLGNKSFQNWIRVDWMRRELRFWKPNFVRVIKYINGETGFLTNLQHELINGFCNTYSIDIVGQQAEVENGCFDVLKALVKGSHGCTIICASLSIVPIEMRSLKNLYFVAEDHQG